MEFPTKVKVGFAVYKIERWPQREASAAVRHGECCKVTFTIRIDESLSDRMAAAFLLHEIMHAAWETFEFHHFKDLAHDKDKEEPYVSAMSSAMATVMEANPHVFEWVQHALKGE